MDEYGFLLEYKKPDEYIEYEQKEEEEYDSNEEVYGYETLDDYWCELYSDEDNDER